MTHRTIPSSITIRSATGRHRPAICRTCDSNPATRAEDDDWKAHSEAMLAEALAALDDRSRSIVTRRWLAERKMTLQELADEYGVSAERIRQVEKNALKKLRKLIDI